MNLQEFIDECRKRTIFRTISIYTVSAWLIIQVAATTFPFLGLPKVAVTLVIICVLLGLPAIMGFSWYYSLRSEGEGNIVVRPDDANPNQIKNTAFRKVYFSITGLISIGVLFVVGSLINQNIKTRDIIEEPLKIARVDEGRVTIERFENKTGDSSLDIIGEMAADRIEHSITQNDLATVVSNNVFKEYDEIFKLSRANGKEIPNVYTYLSINTKIVGNFYLDGDNLLFDCSIIDAHTGEVKDALATIRTSKVDPLAAIDKIKDSVLGYVATKSSAPKLFLETHTPKYEAYKNLLLRNEDKKNELYYLERAIQIDSEYFEPKLLRLSYYYNQDNYDIVDSLYTSLKQESLLADDRQKNLLSFYNYLLMGNNRLVYNYHLKEYNLAPFHLPSNSTMMVLALQYVNRPDMAIKYYKDIPENGLDLASCGRCQIRAYVYSLALFQQGKYKEAALQLESLLKVRGRLSYYKFLAKSYVQLKHWGKLENLITNISNADLDSDRSLYLVIGKECLLIGELNRAERYFEKLLESSKDSDKFIMIAEAQYHIGEYENAKGLFEKQLAQNQNDIDLLFWNAISAFKYGDEEGSNALLLRLELLRNKYDYGAIDYALAKNSMVHGDKTLALTFLQKAVSRGARYDSNSFTNDPFLKDLFPNNTFVKIMNYWH